MREGKTLRWRTVISLICTVSFFASFSVQAVDAEPLRPGAGALPAPEPIVPDGAVDPRPTAGLVTISPSQTNYAEAGGSADHDLRVTNLDTGPRLVDLSWTAPPAGWSVAAYASDGVTPLGDANADSRPDVSLGPAGSPTESQDIVIRVSVPGQPSVNTELTKVTADGGAAGTDDADLTTGVYPFLIVDRWADPTTINRLGMGGGEVTTLTLSLEGGGIVVPGLIENFADIVFVIDDTGSMSGAIDGLKNDINNLTDRLAENVTSLRLGLVSFKDLQKNGRGIDIDIALTFDIAAFKAAVNALVAEGGDDIPEDGDLALEVAANLSWRPGNVTRAMVHITDAETHNNPHLPGVTRWAWQVRGIHTNTVGVGGVFWSPPAPPFCRVEPTARYWLQRAAENGTGTYEEWYVPIPPPLPPICPSSSLGDTLLEGLIYLIPPIDVAARDASLADGDPMVRDVLPPYIAVVPGTFRDPVTSSPRPPDYQGVDASGNAILEWNLSTIRVRETWRVAFDVTCSRAGIVPTNVFGLSRASYQNWSDAPRTTPFPEVRIRVLGPPPRTSLIVGQPNVTAAETWVTSATPLSLVAEDGAGTGIAATWYRVDGGAWRNYTASGPFTLSGEGRHDVEWYSEDLVGAVETVGASRLIVDDTPPIVTFSAGSPSYVSTSTFVTSATPLSLASVDPGSLPVGPRNTFYRIDGGTAIPYSGPFTLSAEGSHRVEFWADDLLGNTGSPVEAEVIVDDTPPMTVARIGVPHHAGADDFVTSATPITLESADGGAIPVGMDAIFYRVDGGPAAAYAGPFTLSGEGRHTIEYWSVDRLGSAELPGSLEVVLDDTPPATSILFGAPTVLAAERFVRSTTTISLSAADGGAIPVGMDAIFYRVDGGPATAYAGPFTLSGEGRHTIEYWSEDLLGNAEAAGSSAVVVDDSPPTTNALAGSPSHFSGDWYVRSTTPITLQAADGGSPPVGTDRVFYRVDDGPAVDYATPFTVSGEGVHLVAFWSVDLLGNAESVQFLRVIVDDTPPATSIAFGTPLHPGTERFVRSTTPVSLSGADGGAVPVGLRTTYVRIDGGAPVAYGSPFKLSGEGRHTIEYWSEDLLGNSEPHQSTTAVVDDTPPASAPTVGTPSYRAANLYVTSETDVTVSSMDRGAIPVGLAAVECSLDGAAWTACPPALRLTGPDGPRAVRVRSADLLGNAEPESRLDLVLDNTPPTTTVSPRSAAATVGTVFTLPAEDAGSGVQTTWYRVDGGDWAAYARGFSLPEGEHEIAYRSIDRVGNREPEKSFRVTIASAPSLPDPEVTVNWKPLVAAAFAAILAAAGAWAARRRPWNGLEDRRAYAKAFAAFSLPFVAAEAATGVVSYATGLLSIPPILGLGTLVDVGILVGGLLVVAWRFWEAGPPAPAEETPFPEPESSVVENP